MADARQELLTPSNHALVLIDYQPQMIFVSAGFDSACGDPLGGLGLSRLGYTYLTQ